MDKKEDPMLIDLTHTDDSDIEARDKCSSNSPSCSGSTVELATSDATTSNAKNMVMKRKNADNNEDKCKMKDVAEEEHKFIKKSKIMSAERQQGIEKSKMKKNAEQQQSIEKSKMKKTAEEKQANEKSKMKKAVEDEQQAIEKSTTKKNAEEQQIEKQKKLEEQVAKRETAKIYMPGQCMKHINIEIHPALSKTWYMADVSREAAAAGCKLSVQASVCDPGLIMWTRTLRPTLTVNDGQVGLSAKERCAHALYVSDASAVAELVRHHKLTDRVRLMQELAACPLTLVIFGANDYFKSNRKTNNSKRKITEIELEMALVDLIVSTRCDGVMAETANDLALLIIQYTKAIAEQPYKLFKRVVDEQEDFYMRGDKKEPLALDADGNGVVRLWQQMIAILPNSSLEKARALCDKYKSPIKLCEALNSPNGIHNLSYLTIPRSNEPNARGRRLGPKFAKKLHILFTSEDGNVVLD